MSDDCPSTIRAQAKQKQSVAGETGKGGFGGKRMDKEVVKAVLASPLIVPWPNIPRHLQHTTLMALPKLVPLSIAEYHLSRARCHRKEKRTNRKISNAEKTVEVSTQVEKKTSELQPDDNVQPSNGESSKRSTSPTSQLPSTKKARITPPASTPSQPTPPDILQHLVLGLNETIKAIEKDIDDLKFRLMLIADALNGNHPSLKPQRRLLSTAPRSPSPPASSSPANQAPLGWVIIPLLSVSPLSLVNPIPQYCATYNSLVYQWEQLRKVVRTRLKETDGGVLGHEREEIRVVPLGKVEMEMAAMVGLRRLACMGVRTSHPQVQSLHDLFPKSVLHPPRHSITLPYPTSNLQVHNGAISKEKKSSSTGKQTPIPSGQAINGTPIRHVHYAPLTIKGITTTAPVDGNARKQRRLEEVRKKRVEVKERKREERRKIMKLGLKGIEKNFKSRRSFKKALKRP